MRRRKCRLWWPSNLSSQAPSPNSLSFLFGWFLSSSEGSLDVVVAFDIDGHKLASSIDSGLDLQEILLRANKNMAALLQDKSKFSLLGYSEAGLCGNGLVCKSGNDKNKCLGIYNDRRQLPTSTFHHGSWTCGCLKFNGLLEQARLAAPESMWIKLVYVHSETSGIHFIPKLDHIHRNVETMSQLDLHDLSNLGLSFKAPKWFKDLHGKDPQLDLDTVIRAINSSSTAQMFIADRCQPKPAASCLDRLGTLAWELFAMSVASVSTVTYIVLQSSYSLSGWVSNLCISIILVKVFSRTWRNIHIRCCQFLYWPIFLQNHNARYLSSVEFAEEAAFRRHSVWFNVVVDILLGNLFGITLWIMAETVSLWVSNFALDITNYWLRTGCVWLMGDPAGFKLNTELAGILGMVSLTVIQIWSTLWGYTSFLLIHFCKGLSLFGIIFGLTAAAAIVVDIISLVTMHILTLHLVLSLLYSTQIQAVASLWRLFSARKWNPLRNRLDSYDYTVEQHVVGSLLFTPIFLLLPTTSAFYIFFTILHIAVCTISITVEVAISFIHATPYAKVLLWLKNKKRFPAGIYFQVTSCRYSDTETSNGETSLPGGMQEKGYASSETTVLVSFLHSNYLNLGEMIWPHYRDFFSVFSWSSISTSAYGLLSGKRIPSFPGADLPRKLPWMAMPWKEYWHICYNSVYSCRGGLNN